MMRRTLLALRRFRREEQGSMTLEFVILVPLIFTIFMTSVEMGIYSMRQMFLDRGLDITVRAIRLSTNTPPTYNQVKQMICDNAGFFDNCDSTLRLEMRAANPRSFNALPDDADCVDLSKPILPPRNYTNGQEHELMIMRACVKFDPVFATSGLGYHFDKDGSGKAKMVSTSAFVQEPT